LLVPLLFWTSHTAPPVNDCALQLVELFPAYQTEWALVDHVPVMKFRMAGAE